MTNPNSFTQREAERLKGALTNAIWVGIEPVAPGTVLKIADRWHILTQVFFEIRDIEAQFSNTVDLFWVGTVNGRTFCILKYDPSFTADEDIVPYMVLEVLDKDSLQVLSEQRVRSLAATVVAAVETSGETYAPAALDFFGLVPEKKI